MLLDFYGLREQPFGATPNPRFVYTSPTHRKALAALLYSVESDLGFSAIVADPGLGKTTLLFQMLETLRSIARTAFIFQTQCGPDELMRHILVEFELRMTERDTAQVHAAFNDFLIAQARVGRRVVIVLDEAQNLPEPTLEFVRLLTNFETPHRKLLSLVLSGQRQLADKLNDPALAQLRQRIALMAHLAPLDRTEVAHYVKHRLRIAGHRSGNLFNGAALDEITAASDGVPRLINQVCFKALSLGCALGEREITAQLVKDAASDPDIVLLRKGASSRMAQPIPMARSTAIAVGGGVPSRPVSSPAPPAAAHGELARPVLQPANSDLKLPLCPPQRLHPHQPLLTPVLLSTEKSETHRQFVLTAVVMLVIAAAALIWFAVAPGATSAAPRAVQHQSTMGPARPSSADGEARPTTQLQTAPRLTSGLRVPPRDANPQGVPTVTMRVLPSVPTVGGIVAASSIVPAKIRVAPRPLYPESAWRLGIGGRVVVEASIDQDGLVRGAQVLEGDPRLRDAAETALRGWFYSPSQVDGRRVPSKATIVFYFHPDRTAQNQSPETQKQGAE